MPRIQIFSTTTCPYCRSAKAFFDQKGIAYEVIDLTGDRAGQSALVERTGRTSVPQIFIGDHHVGGYDDLRALDRAGGLQPLLG
ncbi:MAG: glutaredoxin 3 [Myxococcales bacterium]|nr:glutaredoxin 3 [Myxococcales bacterium]